MLIEIGGLSPYDNVKRWLAKVMTNRLANNFSWMGAKGKKQFRSFNLAKALIMGLQGNPHTKNASEMDAENAIKTWLRHAKERSLKEEGSNLVE